MRRRLFNLLAALSLLLCVAACVLWARNDKFSVSLDDPSASRRQARWVQCANGRIGYYKIETLILGPTTIALSETARDAPLWGAAAFLGVLPAAWGVVTLGRAALGRTGSSAPGRCPGCGYDLRASPNRCPECGVARAKNSPGNLSVPPPPVQGGE